MNSIIKNKYIRMICKFLKIPIPKLILCIGDSLTRGVPDKRGYPEYLEELTGFLCINSGNPGEASNTTDYRIKQELKKYDPDIVLICIGTNDYNIGITSNYTKGYIRSMCLKAKALDIEAIIIGVPDYKEVGMPPVSLKDNPIYAAVGLTENVTVIPDALGIVLSDPSLRDLDGVHATLLGYKTLAKLLANALAEQV